MRKISNNRIKTSLAKRLKEARLAKSFTQIDLAKASGLKQSDISKIERGDTLRPFGLIALSNVLDVSPLWLESGEGEMEKENLYLKSIQVTISIQKALEALDFQLASIAPIFMDSGRDVLTKWLAGEATSSEAEDAISALQTASQTMKK
jgi:transcriptional regulator with XRE-family HTH domain